MVIEDDDNKGERTWRNNGSTKISYFLFFPLLYYPVLSCTFLYYNIILSFNVLYYTVLENNGPNIVMRKGGEDIDKKKKVTK